MISEEITLVMTCGILTILNWWILCKGDDNLKDMRTTINQLSVDVYRMDKHYKDKIKSLEEKMRVDE